MEVYCRFAPPTCASTKVESRSSSSSSITQSAARTSQATPPAVLEMSMDGSPPSTKLGVGDRHTGAWISFRCNSVFPFDTPQEEVYERIALPMLSRAIAGESCAVLAYGQTSTGKTHAMFGPDGGDATQWQGEQRGIIPRVVEDIFLARKIAAAGGAQSCPDAALSPDSRERHVLPPHAAVLRVDVAFFEIYNEVVTDYVAKNLAEEAARSSPRLQTSASSRSSKSAIQVHYKATEKARILSRVARVACTNYDECIHCIQALSTYRQQGTTESNLRSSRSHAVLQLSVHLSNGTCGRLSLVDLAGSESATRASQHAIRATTPSDMFLPNANAAAQAAALHQRQLETKNINTSLFSLKKVIHYLRQSSVGAGAMTHVPFKDSVLTVILEEPLLSPSSTALLVCCSMRQVDSQETLATLRFASDASEVEPWACPDTAPNSLEPPVLEVGGAADQQRLQEEVEALRECRALLTQENETLRRELHEAKTELARSAEGAQQLMRQCDRLAASYAAMEEEVFETQKRAARAEAEAALLRKELHCHSSNMPQPQLPNPAPLPRTLLVIESPEKPVVPVALHHVMRI